MKLTKILIAIGLLILPAALLIRPDWHGTDLSAILEQIEGFPPTAAGLLDPDPKGTDSR